MGIVLTVLGLGLLVAELHVSTGGALGGLAVAGIVAGAALAILGTGQNPLLVIPIAAIPGAVCTALVVYAARNTASLRARLPRTGPHTLVGRVASVRATPDPIGQVFVDGALWRARSFRDERLEIGEEVVVVNVREMTLFVARVADGGRVP
ncbi:MAG: NfeD family protein [Candidatus Dormiibacterota bacterium]